VSLDNALQESLYLGRDRPQADYLPYMRVGSRCRIVFDVHTASYHVSIMHQGIGCSNRTTDLGRLFEYLAAFGISGDDGWTAS
jgi:hypothetical protein